jgi:AcrR family transcriptional regulator
MGEKDKNTEEKIIQAAEKEFIEKGMAGARMQQIANNAGINKALLHYYYRSKEKLFGIIFKIAFKTFIPNLLGVFEGEEDFYTKLRKFIRNYLSIIEKNPHIPSFVLHEISHNPENLAALIKEIGIDVDFIQNQILEEIEKGNMKPIKPYHLLINVISLCVFPIAAKPMISSIIFKGNQADYKNMLEERKDHVADFIINSIKP